MQLGIWLESIFLLQSGHPLVALELNRLRVGKSSVDLEFERKADGSVATNIAQVQGRLDVEMIGDQKLVAA